METVKSTYKPLLEDHVVDLELSGEVEVSEHVLQQGQHLVRLPVPHVEGGLFQVGYSLSRQYVLVRVC